MESMLGQRKLTTGEIQKHFDGFGLEPQFAQHTRMGALSGTVTAFLFPLYRSDHFFINDVCLPNPSIISLS